MTENIKEAPSAKPEGGEVGFAPKAAPPATSLIVKATSNNLPKIISASELLSDQSLVVPEEIVDNLIHKGTKVILASGSKIGKTYVLIYMGASVAAGAAFVKYPTSAGAVLIVDGENPPAFFKKRLEHVRTKLGLSSLDNLDVWTLRGQAVDIETLVDQIIERSKDKHYVLIILDPAYKLMPGSENSASSVALYARHLDRIVQETGAAVVYAHHFTKGNSAKKKSIDRMSGSGVFARDADTIITLTEHAVKDCYTVEITLRNLPPQAPFVVEWDFPIMVERPDLDASDLKVEGAENVDELEPLLELLDEKPLTTGDWQKAAEKVGYSRANFFRKMKMLEDGKYLTFDRKEKTWARAVTVPIAEAGTDRPENLAKPVGTNETTEGKTKATVPVSSPTSPKSLKSSDRQ